MALRSIEVQMSRDFAESALVYPCDVLLSAHFLIAGYSLNYNGFIVLSLLWLTSPKEIGFGDLVCLLAYNYDKTSGS